MTKAVRIENADMGRYQVAVDVMDKSTVPGEPDKLAHTVVLNNPTDMSVGLYITETRYLVVREAPYPA